MKRTMVFDTETTALVANHSLPLSAQPHVVEFYGAILNARGDVVEEMEFLCKPPVPITEEITKITGISPSMVEECLPFAEYAEALQHFIESADSVAAHNLSYDFFVLGSEFERLGTKLNWPIVRICTVEQTVHLRGHRMNLSSLHEHLFGETFIGAHRARRDVEALIRCFNRLREEDMV